MVPHDFGISQRQDNDRVTTRKRRKPNPHIVHRSYERRIWLLIRLRECDGPQYDELIRELISETNADDESNYTIGVNCVRAVRSLLWNELAVTESDESVWLTPRGWNQEQINYALKYIGQKPEPRSAQNATGFVNRRSRLGN